MTKLLIKDLEIGMHITGEVFLLAESSLGETRAGTHGRQETHGGQTVQVRTDYALKALDLIRVGVVHLELRERLPSRELAAEQLSRATEFLLKEKLTDLGRMHPGDRISYPALVRRLAPYLRPDEERALLAFRTPRDGVIHDPVQLRAGDMKEFEAFFPDICRFLLRFLSEELHMDLSDELDSPFLLALRGAELDLHDKALLRSKAALEVILVEHDVEDGVGLANEAVDLAIRAVAEGLGVAVQGIEMDEVVEILAQQERGSEAYYFYGNEMHYFQPGDFQAYYADFSEIEEAERYVRLVRDVVDGLLDRARRPRWEARIRDRWPQVVALLRDRSPKTAEMIPLDALSVEVSGIHVAIRGVVERSGLEYHCEAIMAGIRREVPELPREFTARFGVIMG